MNEQNEDREYCLEKMSPLDLCPCPAGVMAVYREDGDVAYLEPIFAFAVCKVEMVRYRGSQELSRWRVQNAISGVVVGTDGILLAEEADNLVGYLRPEQDKAKWLKEHNLKETPGLEIN